MKNSTLSVFIVGGMLLVTGSFVAYADLSDIRRLEETKITLIQAVEAAQKHQGGQAVEATIDDDSFKPAYEVSIAKDGKLFDVQIDGLTGEVLGSREDIDD